MIAYNDPGDLGLELVGEVDYSDGDYNFDLVAVWRDPKTGDWFYAEDSGCSCPSPFEDYTTRESLMKATPHEIATRLQERATASSYVTADAPAELIERIMRLRLEGPSTVDRAEQAPAEEPPGVERQWVSFWGGPDPESSAGWQEHEDQDDAEENARWRIEGGVASRPVTYGPWRVIPTESGEPE